MLSFYTEASAHHHSGFEIDQGVTEVQALSFNSQG